MRVHFSAWGSLVKHLQLPSYAVKRHGETDFEAVVRSICTFNSLVPCGLIKNEGFALPERARQYSVTLGERCPGGGWAPKGQLWFTVQPQ